MVVETGSTHGRSEFRFNSISTLQGVMGGVMMTQSSLVRFGKMSGAQLSDTSMKDGSSDAVAE